MYEAATEQQGRVQDFVGGAGGGGGGHGNNNVCKESNMKWRGVPEALFGDSRMIQSNFGRVFCNELMIILFCKTITKC